MSRGLSQDEAAVYDAWSNAHELREPFFMWYEISLTHVIQPELATLERHHLPSYPIPTSFPPIFPNPRPKTLKLISSLSTSPSTGGQLSSYAHFVENAAKRRHSALLAMGLEEDEVRELVSALWGIVDEYGDDEDGGDLSEGMGEDEE